MLNADNEVAVAAFLDHRIGFGDIPAVIEGTLEARAPRRTPGIWPPSPAPTAGPAAAPGNSSASAPCSRPAPEPRPVLTLIAFVFVVGTLVIIHELGHYLTARFIGVRVETFSIGFPPNIYRRRSARPSGRWARCRSAAM